MLRTRPDMVAGWSDQEVAKRWLTLFPKQRIRKGRVVSTIEEEILALAGWPDRIAQLRVRLSSLSWYMGRLNEFMARAANKEDKVKGRFWEGRFKCQALLDEAAIAACMVYVDLNPIRAGLAGRLEESDFTSIQERIRAWQRENLPSGAVQAGEDPRSAVSGAEREPMGNISEASIHIIDPAAVGASWLCPISSDSGRRGILPMEAGEYIALVDRSGRLLRSDKRGAIERELAPILQRIGVKPEAWVDVSSRFGSRFRLAAGLLASLRGYAERLGRRWFQGVQAARAAFARPTTHLA